MQDRFKFRAVLKTDTHSIITEPYYILGNGYFVNIDDVQKPFEKKYPNDCFWEFIEEIEKQKNCQEVSTDSEIIIFDSFDSLIQCTGIKDKNGKLIYEGDILKDKYGALHQISWNVKGFYEADIFAVAGFYNAIQEDMEVIGNVYENPELLEMNNERQ